MALFKPGRRLTTVLTLAGASLVLVAGIVLVSQLKDRNGFVDVAAKKAAKQVAKAERKKARGEFFFQMLKDPATGHMPTKVRDREVMHAKDLFHTQGISGTAATQSTEWFEVGPNDVGGRTRALLVDRGDSNTIFAGGVSGGVWKSTDAGASWTLKTATNQAVTYIAQDPATPSTLYYCTGELDGSAGDQGQTAPYFGSGLYKSTDSGESWIQIQSAGNATSLDTEFDYMSKVMVHPISGSVFIASNGVGLSRSDDGGATFGIALGNYGGHRWCDFDIASNGIIVAVISEQNLGADPTNLPGVYGSNDNGATWIRLTPSTFPETHRRSVVAIPPSNPDAAYVLTDVASDDVRLHKITLSTGQSANLSANLPNFGKPVGEVNTQGGYNLMLSVKPNDENFVILGWTNLFRSTDGVTTPMNVAQQHWIGGYAISNDISKYASHHPDNHIVAFDPNNANAAWSGHDGGLSYVADISATPLVWTSKNNAYNITQFYDISIHPAADDGRAMGGTQDNGSPFFRAGETSSTDISSGDGATCFMGTSTLLSSSQNGEINHFVYDGDGNPSFEGVITKPTGASALFIHPFAVDATDETTVYYPSAEHFYRHSGGGNWDELTGVSAGPGYTITAVAVSETNSTLYYGAFQDGVAPVIYRQDNAKTSSDGEVNISVPGVPAGAYPHAITVNPNDPNEVIVVFSNYNIVGLYHSLDGGSSWTAIEGNLTGTGGGGVASTSAQAAVGPSLRDALICLGAENAITYFVATSTGVYSTEQLNGDNTAWALENPAGMGNVVVNSLAGRKSDGWVAAGTHGRGLFAGRKGPLTPVKLAAYSVTSVEGRVRVEWTTTEETQHLGFHVWRAEDGRGSFEMASTAMITEAASSAGYEFIDADVVPGRRYTYRLEALGRTGQSEFFDLSSVVVAASPSTMVMHPARPNPFRSTTAIAFDLPRPGQVRLSIFDVSGRLVRNLADEYVTASRYEASWDGKDDQGRTVPAGTYMIRLRSGETDLSRKVVYTQ